jgi:hypothetical protein
MVVMNEGEGLQLLRNKLQDPPVEVGAVDLLRALDCIPFTVTQAAAYINRRGRITVASFLDEYQKTARSERVCSTRTRPSCAATRARSSMWL